jgi:hypothetical protein
MSQQSKFAEMDLKQAITVFTKTLLWKLHEGHPVANEELEALNSLRANAGMGAIQIPKQEESAPKQNIPRPQQKQLSEPSEEETGLVVRVPSNVVFLPDNAGWKKRMDYTSDSGNTYRIAQNKDTGAWGCTCWPYKKTRNCGHLRDLGLSSQPNNTEVTLKKGSKTASEMGWKFAKTEVEIPADPRYVEAFVDTILRQFAARAMELDIPIGRLVSTIKSKLTVKNRTGGKLITCYIPENDTEYWMKLPPTKGSLFEDNPDKPNMRYQPQLDPATGLPKSSAKKIAGRYKLWVGPTLVKGVAEQLREAGVNVTVEGTEAVIFESSVEDEVGAIRLLRVILGDHWGVDRVQKLAADLMHSDNDLDLKMEPATPTSAPQVAGPEAGPSNDELHASGHSENGENGSPMFDGKMKHPERQNVNAIREALATQVEMEVGKPIQQKQEEVAMQEKVQDAAMAQGAGGLAGGEGVATLTGPGELTAKPGTQIVINIAAKKAAGEYADWCDACIFREHPEVMTSHAPGHGTVAKCERCGNNSEVRTVKVASVKKVAYVEHCKGHRNSKGELAEWCIKQHNTHKILESFKSEGAAKEGLKNMESHKHGTEEKDAAFRSQRVQISEGSGLDSGKEGTILPWDDARTKEVREDYPFVGGRTPESMGWLAVLLDDGMVTAMPKTRLMQIKRSAEPIGGEPEQQNGITSGQGGGYFGGTDLEGPSFHVGFTVRGARREASFKSFVQVAKFVKDASSKFGAKDWTMKGAAVDEAKRQLVLEWLKTNNLTTGEIEKRLGGGKYTNTAYPILHELAKEGLVKHKQMRWYLKQASATELFDVKVKVAGDGMAKTENELEKEAGFNFFFPGQVLTEFYPEIQHEIVDYPNAKNDAMGLETPDIVGDGGHELEGVLDDALDTTVVEMIQLPADISDPMSMAAADYSSTSPAGGMGIGRDGKPEVLEGAPLRKENDIRGYMFTDEFYGQYEGIPGAAMQVASMKTAAEGGEKEQFARFLKLVCGEIAATMVAAFKVTQRPLLDKVPGVGEVQLDTMEQGSAPQPMGSTSQGGRMKYILSKINDGDIKAAINDAWAQAAVWNDSPEGGFVYEVFVRPETIDTDSMKLTYKFVAGTRE